MIGRIGPIGGMAERGQAILSFASARPTTPRSCAAGLCNAKSGFHRRPGSKNELPGKIAGLSPPDLAAGRASGTQLTGGQLARNG
jgi:hypothetical protein